MVQNFEAHNFYPAPPSSFIDSAVNTLEDRDDFANRVKAPLGLPPSPIQAPLLDATGNLRQDNPKVASAQGQGDNVFKDRGALDWADFTDPTAALIDPQDNDFAGVDHDPASTVVQLQDGVYSQFVVQIQDQYNAANPFPGTGAADSTIQTAPVTVDENGLLLALNGPAITLFEDNRFLREGYDYTFRYDALADSIILTPLAGIWPDGKVYQIKLNNKDRFVIDAPNGAAANDGATFTITDDTGARVTFEYDSGYRMQVPATLTINVPVAGGGAGGISDGQKFTINDGKRSVVFEFDSNGAVAFGSRAISFTPGSSQDAMADAIVAAINSA
ncbi:MAG TPA: hypothetical protein PLV92_30050, partial [Pirellulaceae bacterium]|nr:hypothetical protein [Pirellulaceae bacterium]